MYASVFEQLAAQCNSIVEPQGEGDETCAQNLWDQAQKSSLEPGSLPTLYQIKKEEGGTGTHACAGHAWLGKDQQVVLIFALYILRCGQMSPNHAQPCPARDQALPLLKGWGEPGSVTRIHVQGLE